MLALARNPAKGQRLAALGIEVLLGDLTDAARMEELVSANVQIVMHLGAWLRGAPVHLARRVNVEATRRLAEICARAHVERLVFTSSIAVYGPHGDRDVDESTPVHPYGDPYGDSKIQAEAALRSVAEETGLACVIVRPGMVYGPESLGWTTRMATWARRGWCPLVDGGCGMAYPIYIDNLVDLLILCTTHPGAVGGTFNAVDDGPVTLGEFLGAYMAMVPTRRAIVIPGWLLAGFAALFDPFVPSIKLTYVANQMRGRGLVANQRAKQVLGWSPQVTFTEGMRRSELWLRSQGIL